MAMKNYYKILNVPYDAGLAQIKSAYRRLVKLCHPDISRRTSAADFRLIKEAYDILSDPEKRREYNNRMETKLPGQTYYRDSRIFVPPYKRDVYDDLVEVMGDYIGFPGKRKVNVDLYLSDNEFAEGAKTMVCLPQDRICPRCFGFGGTLLSTCDKCGGLGIVGDDLALEISLKPPLYPGQIYEVVERNYSLRFRLKRGE
jgi:DnaJ-class molecular chaperone